MTVDGKVRKLSFEDFKNILAQELDYLDIPKNEWNSWVNSLYGDSKYKYHKNHEKHLSDDSPLFRDFLSSAPTTKEEVRE